MPQSGKSVPTVFISYSWEGPAHKDWVRDFAVQLRADGVKVRLDQWELVPGDQLAEFMRREIRRNKYVLIICTPRYKKRADKGVGGVGYEGDIMTAQVLSKKTPQARRRIQRKFIPILREGTWERSAPDWLEGKYRIELNANPYSKEQCEDLLTTLHDARPKAPDVGERPVKYRIQELRKHLESPDVDERIFAIKALQRIGPAAVPTLALALKHDTTDVLLAVAKALQAIGPAAVPALVAALKDDNAWVRQMAAEALGRIGPAAEAAVPALVAALKDDDVEVRQMAANTLGRIGAAAKAAVPALVAALKDNYNVGSQAMFALVRIGPAAEAAVPALVAALKDDNDWVRRMAANSLAEIGPAAVPALVASLKDDDVEVRQVAANTLGRIRG
jgi:hypothetical protein